MSFLKKFFTKTEKKSLSMPFDSVPSVFFLTHNGDHYDWVESKLPKTLPELIDSEPTISGLLNSISDNMFYASLQIRKLNNQNPDQEIPEYQKYLTPILYPKSHIGPHSFQEIFLDYLKRFWKYGIWGFVLKEDLNGNYIQTILPSVIALNTSYGVEDSFYEVMLEPQKSKIDFKKNVKGDWFYTDDKSNYYLYVIANIDTQTYKVQSPIFSLGKYLIILAAVSHFLRDYNIRSFRPAGILSVTRKFPSPANRDVPETALDKELAQIKLDFVNAAKNGTTIKHASKNFEVDFIPTQQNIDINSIIEQIKFCIALVTYNLGGSSKSVALDLQDYSNNTAIKQNQVFENQVNMLNTFLKKLDVQFLHKYLKRKLPSPTIRPSVIFENLENDTWVNIYTIHADLTKNPEYRKKLTNDIMNYTKGGLMGIQDGTKILSDIMENIFGKKLQLPPENLFAFSSRGNNDSKDKETIRRAKDASEVAERVIARSEKVTEEVTSQ